MSTSVCARLAAIIERSRIATKTEAKLDNLFTIYSSSINTSPNNGTTHSHVLESKLSSPLCILFHVLSLVIVLISLSVSLPQLNAEVLILDTVH